MERHKFQARTGAGFVQWFEGGLACATVSSVMSQLFQVTTITMVCSTRFCTSASLLWLWIASTLQSSEATQYQH